MRCSSKFSPWPSSFLIQSSLLISFNLIILIISFVGVPIKIGIYWYPFKPYMFSLLDNYSYILNLCFKSEKFTNNISPNRILPMNLLLSYLKTTTTTITSQQVILAQNCLWSYLPPCKKKKKSSVLNYLPGLWLLP